MSFHMSAFNTVKKKRKKKEGLATEWFDHPNFRIGKNVFFTSVVDCACAIRDTGDELTMVDTRRKKYPYNKVSTAVDIKKAPLELLYLHSFGQKM